MSVLPECNHKCLFVEIGLTNVSSSSRKCLCFHGIALTNVNSLWLRSKMSSLLHSCSVIVYNFDTRFYFKGEIRQQSCFGSFSLIRFIIVFTQGKGESCEYLYIIVSYLINFLTSVSWVGTYRSRIHESTNLLRFLAIILIVLRVEVFVYNVYISNQFQATFAWWGRGGEKSVSIGDCE